MKRRGRDLRPWPVTGDSRSSHDPPDPTGTVFVDVPVTHPFAKGIEELAREGITGGCATSPPRYCPNATVTRAEMAVFLVRALNRFRGL